MDDIQEATQPIDIVCFTSQRRSQIEPEAVDMHLLNPVAQAVHDQLQCARRLHVQRVTAACVIHVVARITMDQSVIGRIVETLHRQCGTEVIPFAGVVVDHVKDHFEAVAMQRTDHPLEFVHCGLRLAIGGEPDIGRKEAQRVVAPIVLASLIE
jgi:hypothetical protein